MAFHLISWSSARARGCAVALVLAFLFFFVVVCSLDHNLRWGSDPETLARNARPPTAGFRPLELHPSAPVDTILSSFFAWQSQMVRSVADLGGCLPRALVWHADSGLGNRVQQFPTMVKYAALSSRVLVVDWPHPGTFDRYFEPLPTPMYRIEDLGPLLCKAQAYTARPPDKDVIRRDLIAQRAEEIRRRGDSALPPILDIKHHSGTDDAIRALSEYKGVPEPPLDGVPLKRVLMRPSALLEEVMRPALERMRGGYTVGLQLRAEYLDFGQDQLFFRCFEEIAEAQAGQKVIMFLTTDSQEIVDNFRELMDPERFLYLDKTIVHIDLDTQSQDTLSMDKTMADFFLLTRSDVVVSTHGSSFGNEAALMGMPPDRVTRPHSLGNYDCRERQSACEDFDPPAVCPGVRGRLRGGWRTFTMFEKNFRPEWKNTGAEKRQPPN